LKGIRDEENDHLYSDSIIKQHACI
jgi:hypothetical protein